MKKHYYQNLGLTLIIAFFSLPLLAQYDFTKADSIAKNIISEEVELTELAQQLTQDLSTEAEKARALYMWVAGNVRYDCKKYHNRKTPKFTARSEAELAEKVAAYYEKGIVKTLQRQRGVCEDYSRLYKAMSDAVGLETVLVEGNARDFHKPYKKALDNPHAWNATKIEGKWYLLDATWGAGYTNAEVTQFKKRLSPGYFMVDPVSFVQTHYPDESKWQLLDKPLSKKAFANQPMVNVADVKYQIEEASPQIEASQNGKRMVRFKFKNPPKYLMVSNRRSKPIPFKKRIEGDYIVLEFSKSSAKKVVIWGGNSKKRLNWMAMYKA